MQTYRNKRTRSAVGQALMEGAVVLAAAIPIFIAALLFLFNVGMSMYYKEKVSFIAEQVAKYAGAQVGQFGNACNPTLNQHIAQENANKQLYAILHNLGLPAQATVTATVQNNQMILVNIHLYNLPLIGGGFSFIPINLNLEEVATANLAPFVHDCQGSATPATNQSVASSQSSAQTGQEPINTHSYSTPNTSRQL